MVGLFIGSFVFGFISDKFGRKIALLGCILVSSSASLAGSFMTDYWSYMALRLVTAAGSVGLFNEAFTMTVELMGSKEVKSEHSLYVEFYLLLYSDSCLAAVADL